MFVKCFVNLRCKVQQMYKAEQILTGWNLPVCFQSDSSVWFFNWVLILLKNNATSMWLYIRISFALHFSSISDYAAHWPTEKVRNSMAGEEFHAHGIYKIVDPTNSVFCEREQFPFFLVFLMEVQGPCKFNE